MASSNHRRGKLESIRVGIVLGVLAIAVPVAAQPSTARVMGSGGALQGNLGSTTPVISSDGRWVAFYSYASNLVSGDTNGVADVFVYDRLTATTTRASVGVAGVQGNAESSNVAISADGRFVAFESYASNLVTSDTNNRQDIFVRDLQMGITTRVSVGSGNIQGDDNSWVPTISADGRFVTFDSWATTLVSGDTNATADIFVHDRQSGTTTRVSVFSGGGQGNGPSYRPAISADGRWVTFNSYAANLVPGDTNGAADIFVYDQFTLITERVSIGPGGAQSNSDSGASTISGDGRYVAFHSWASNLVAGDTNARLDAFVHDRYTHTTTRVSIGPGGVQGNDNTYGPVISDDGRWVTFDSWASTLVALDSNGGADVFVHDRQTSITTRVSVASTGLQGNSTSHAPSISADGRSVVFYSYATNLVASDTNAAEDVFIHSRGGTIAGTVTNSATTAPASNVQVASYSTSGSLINWTLTNAQGAYVLPPMATGSYYLVTWPASGLTGELHDNVPCPNGACLLSAGTLVTVTAPGATIGIDFALDPILQPWAFYKSSPGNGTIGQVIPRTLSWGSSNGATSYEYCYDLTNDNVCVPWQSAGSSTFVNLIGLTPNTTYYWQVRAVSPTGTTYANGSATAFWSFTTESTTPYLDLNGDGRGDAFTYDSATGNWSRQVSLFGGGFTTTTGTWAAGWTVDMARFNIDGYSDFFLFNSTTGQWAKMLNNGSGFTTQATGVWWPGWERHVLDLDGDGVSDLVLHDPSTGAWFRCVSTSNGFSYTQGAWNPGWEVYPMRLDIDARGDLFLINRTTGRWFWAVGDASAGFIYPVTGTWYAGWELHPGDFNADSLTDLLLHDPATGTYFIATTTGAGFSYAQGSWSLGWKPHVMDINADRKADLFLHDPVTGNWFEMIGDGAGGFTNVGGQTWSLGWNLYPTDGNADGRADMVLYDPATGVWYQARNLVNGAFSYNTGSWAPGLQIITRGK